MTSANCLNECSNALIMVLRPAKKTKNKVENKDTLMTEISVKIQLDTKKHKKYIHIDSSC